MRIFQIIFASVLIISSGQIGGCHTGKGQGKVGSKDKKVAADASGAAGKKAPADATKPADGKTNDTNGDADNKLIDTKNANIEAGTKADAVSDPVNKQTANGSTSIQPEKE
jgi:hypothetical protein